jgi:allophanate hydrolase
MNETISLDLQTLADLYARKSMRPADVIEVIYRRMEAHAENPIWISLVPKEQALAQADELENRSREAGALPLYGIPFAVKDNIDVAGFPTTVACPEFTYHPEHTAFVVQRLLEAGALFIGKTNLDQFATGLNGTRSPYGACRNLFKPEFIAGGSSSGSGLAVAAGLVSFALGTDTAGSGRIPAAFGNIVGLKPTRGLLSNRGVFPACRSLDCVSIFALSNQDAMDVFKLCAGFDPEEIFSRPVNAPAMLRSRSRLEKFRFGVPAAAQLEFFGDGDAETCFHASLERLSRLGGRRVEIDFRPFTEVAKLLYDGPWLAERYIAVGPFLEKSPESLLPITRSILERSSRFSAADAFSAFYRLKQLKRTVMAVWSQIEVLMTPTAGTLYRIDEIEADPVTLNTRLGYYTNFMNLLDLCAVAVPAGFTQGGLPFGVTLSAPAFSEPLVCGIGDALHRACDLNLGATPHKLPVQTRMPAPQDYELITVAVCGSHMSGLPLNHELVERGARLIGTTATAAKYRLYALDEMLPPRPALVRVKDTRGNAIEVELWEMPLRQFGNFVRGVPPPLCIGTVDLVDGRRIKGFLSETWAVKTARDISAYGGWRGYLASKKSP